MNTFVQNVVGRMSYFELIKPEEQDDFIYYIELFLEKMIAMSSIFLMAAYMNKIVEIILFLTVYSSIRKYAGGYHCKTFMSCYLLSVGVAYLSICPLFDRWHLEEKNPVLFILISISVILFVGAVNHPDMCWDKKELHNSKNMARSIALLQGGIIISLWYLELFHEYVLYMSEGIFFSAMSILVAKIIRQEVRV